MGRMRRVFASWEEAMTRVGGIECRGTGDARRQLLGFDLEKKRGISNYSVPLRQGRAQHTEA